MYTEQSHLGPKVFLFKLRSRECVIIVILITKFDCKKNFRQFSIKFWTIKLPYILAYKSRNFGHFLANIFLIQHIRGSETMIQKWLKLAFFNIMPLNNFSKQIIFFSNFGHSLANIFSIWLIHGSTYTRVYTVFICSNFWLSVSHRAIINGKNCFLNFVNLSNWTNFNFFYKYNTTLKFRHNWTLAFPNLFLPKFWKFCC